ncbi:Do family serine endopeptidase [Caldimonas tepidiphila]|uniref:Do family serine endopeptidase n=1 Tax=Caldimonas tepidiphila TaxID=2315841 RepID=UPI000E5B489F|nr:Do family serine endopeptidase [Caldimonas tepidiphila]
MTRSISPTIAPVLLCAALLAACSKQQQDAAPTAAAPASAPASAPAASAASTAAPPDFTALVRKVGPAVVNVVTTRNARQTPAQMAPGDPMLEYFRRFMPQQPPGGGQEAPGGGIGSGFIIDAQGHILTNAHVVAGADEVQVRLADSKREFKARVVGIDPQTDVALLKVDAQDLPTATLGDSSKLQPGEWVAAIGSPFGFANTITAGIVSATERALPDEMLVPFIQTDVAVNPGNSGGPLLNVRGEVIGINSQIYSRTGGYMGLSFAIPIGLAMEVADQLRTEGRVTRGRLGIGIQEVSPELAQSFKLNEPRGALVTSVEPNGPAQRGGIAIGDVILSVNQQPVRDAGDLPRIVARTKPDTQVQIEVWRNGASQTLNATMGEMPSTAPPPARPEPAGGMQSPGANQLGIVVSELPPQGRRVLGVPYGLVVQGVQSASARSPLQPGDVIIGVNNQPFANLEEFNRHVSQAAPGSTLALLVRRGDANLYVPIPVGKG